MKRDTFSGVDEESRWAKYNQMMQDRDPISFTKPGHCKKCGRLWGNHASKYALRQNPNACRFVR